MSLTKFSTAAAAAVLLSAMSSQAMAAVTTFVLTGTATGSVTGPGLSSPFDFRDVALEFDVVSSAIGEVDDATVMGDGMTGSLDPTQFVFGADELGLATFGPDTGTVAENVSFSGTGLIGVTRAHDIVDTPVTANTPFTPFVATVGGQGYTVTINDFTDADFSLTTVGGTVPEPAAWSLMLVGFSGLGAALRRSRKAMASITA
jgi:PEP-CTERM motif